MTAFKRRGKWAAKYVADGKQVWVPGGPWESKSAAQEAERRHRERVGAQRSSETCASWAKRWLTEWPRPQASTRRQYADAARRFADHFGPTPLGEVERLNARTWALTQPRQISRVIGTMYADARNVGLVEHNPFANLRLPAVERKREITAPTMEEYRALLDACMILGGYGPEFKAMIQFSAWTGVRAGELQALRWEDVGESTIRIEGTRKRDGSVGPPKNGKARTIAFPPPARVLDGVPRRPDPFVFHSPRSKPLVQGSHHYAWRTVRANAGLPEIRWHDLRHFAATQLLDMGLDPIAVALQLGHTDNGQLIMQTYGHPSEDAARARLLGLFEMDEDAIGSPSVAAAHRRPHGRAG